MFDENRFRAQVALRGKSYKEVSAALNIDESTLYRKIKNNGSFTRKEINMLIEFLRIEDPAPIFFTEKLA